MKKILFPLFAIALFTACTDAPSGTDAETSSSKNVATSATGTPYKVDGNTSKINWSGATPTHGHEGAFLLSDDGTITVDNNNITAGNFTIKIPSLQILDKDTNGSAKLIGHLLSPDFFDATKYPTAKFELTACEPIANDSLNTHKISGNLILKDSTKNVSFPAKVILADNVVTATASFVIDRTQWGLHYGNDKSLKDHFIYPEVKISLLINANK